jgi:hypothetical protein
MVSVMIAPRMRPAASALAPTAPHTPSARLRWSGSSNDVVMIDSAAGVTNAAPMPCTARMAISSPGDSAKPPISDAAVNSAMPEANTARRPRTSAMRPPSSSRPAMATP